MPNKTDEALKLSEEILNDFESTLLPTSSILLKCLKLSRIMQDDNAIEWLLCEIHGYKGNKDGIEPEIFEIACQHGRELNKGENRTIFIELSIELEDEIDSCKKAIGSYTTAGVSVAGEKGFIAMANLTNTVKNSNDALINNVSSLGRKLSILKGEYYNYALEINMQLKFSNKVEDIFNEYRINVDSQLVDLVPKSIKKLASIYSRLTEDDLESWSQAFTTCRKLIVEFSDSLFCKVYPKNTEEKIKVKSGKEIDISGDKYVNRISVSLDKIILNDMKKDNIMLTISWIESINNRVCKGIHNDISFEEVRNIIIHLYIMFADVLSDYQLYQKNLELRQEIE